MADRAERLPNWGWDETLLAWDLYLREYAGRVGPSGAPRYADAAHPSVIALSEELRSLPSVHPEDVRRRTDFRNPAGVARKVQNLMWCATRRWGSPHASAMDRLVVATARNAEHAGHLVRAIRRVAASVPSDPLPGEDEFAATEGTVLPRSHLQRERSRSLVDRKKREVIRSGRAFSCEVCDVDVATVYGVPPGAVIECHHRLPLSSGTRRSTTADLALVCPTCHRALHRIAPEVTVEGLRARLGSRA
jgi:5-methylcytosine-specific restriction enzyme A